MRERVGCYRLLRRLGGGGMGEVFEAVHDRLERRVAIKFLHAQLSTHPQVAARFLNEARAVNIVRHPGLVDIYELGQLEDGGLYIIMELLDGETLSARLRRQGVLAGEAVLRVGRQIAGALAAAHAAGIVHRDLKPDNIMLVGDAAIDGGERVKVLDFGIAKVLASGQTPVGNLTHTGLILGTPQYMAPEQCRGGGDVDGRADVYALGLVLYEALTGAPPFTAGGEWELFAMQLNRVPAPLPATVKPALASLVARMLDKDREQRPAMADIAAHFAELRSASGGPLAPSLRETIRATPAPPRAATTLHSAAGEKWPRAEARPSRAPRVALATSVLAIALAAVGAWRWHVHTIERLRAPADDAAAVATAATQPASAATSTSDPSAAPATMPSVRWTITSLPSGAMVERADTDEPLGETPWHREQPAAGGTLRVRLTLPGHRARELVLRRDGDEHHQVRLPPLRRHNDNEDDDVQTVH